ncbi:hypothetical protein AURDEDRAFT_36363, partial [Auricularia subglabra TFB-10046 SS5]
AAYMLDLPPELKKRRIHPTFHANLLREHVENDDVRFPGRQIEDIKQISDLSFDTTVNEIVGFRWKDNSPTFFVTWSDGLTTEEDYATVAQLQAFDEF